MIERLMEQERIEMDLPLERVVPDWKALLRQEIDQAISRGGGRWSRALMAVAWIHLLAFFVCHLLHSPRQDSDPRHILVWFIELVTVFVAMRIFAGKGWFWSPQAIHFIGRLWLTLLILSFSLSTLNAAIGWQTLFGSRRRGNLEQLLLRHLGVADHAAIPDPRRTDVRDGLAHGPFYGLEQPDLRCIVVAGVDGNRVDGPKARERFSIFGGTSFQIAGTSFEIS